MSLTYRNVGVSIDDSQENSDRCWSKLSQQKRKAQEKYSLGLFFILQDYVLGENSYTILLLAEE